MSCIEALTLHPDFVIKDQIKGIGPYTYERYLLEFVNESVFFRNKLNADDSYKQPDSEAHGECDCKSEKYEMDFKLLETKSKLQSKSLFSLQNQQVVPGVVIKCVARKQRNDRGYKPIYATNIFPVLKRLSLDDLTKIQNGLTAEFEEFDDKMIEDIFQLINTVSCNKNLFLFLPYIIHIKNEITRDSAKALLLDVIKDFFENLLCFRSEVCPNRDTYLCFFMIKV